MLLFTTLGRYLTLRFTRAILSVFSTFFFLIGTLDFVELMRRAGDSPIATTPKIIMLALYRVPSVAEQIFPFAALFGGMFALLTLSRKLELVVARSAGVSAWQFLQPAVVVAGVIGLVSVMAYNPLAAEMKRRATALETRLFVRAGGQSAASLPEIWLRQTSVDGQAIIRAAGARPDEDGLSGVTVFNFNHDGSFRDRIDARQAVLRPGHWELSDARLTSATEEPQSYKNYTLATTLEPDQMRQSESLPAWLWCRTLKHSASATPFEGSSRRFAVTSTKGVSWRKAFRRRRTPFSRSPAPSSTGAIWSEPNSSCRSR